MDGFSHTGKKGASTLGSRSVCVCRREMWKSVLPESLSAIFLVVCLFVSLFLPFRGIIPLFDMRFVPEFSLLCVKIFVQRTKENQGRFCRPGRPINLARN